MKRSEFYGFRLPERGAREGEANDPADIEDLTFDLGLIDAELERQRVEDVNLEKNKATREELLQHTGSTANPHKVTKAQVGLDKVPNVATNDQTPTYEAADAPAALVSGETLFAAFGKIAAAVSALIGHLADEVRHITAVEREAWDSASQAKHTHGNKALLDTYEQTEEDLAAAVSARHTHGNKGVLDGITQVLVDRWNTVTEKLPLAGGTLTGPLTLHAAPTEDLHAATKKYVDDTMAETGSGDKNVAGYVGEITWFADNILRQNHVWADGAPINAEQWPELASHAAEAGWEQNEDGQYLTPDLSGRVLISASDSYAVNQIGGANNVTLSENNLPPFKYYVRNNLNSYVVEWEDTQPQLGGKYGTVVSGNPTFGGTSYYIEKTNPAIAIDIMQPYYTAKAQIRARVEKIIATVTCPWEVGDILETKNATPPSVRWPGTEWEEITGRFLLGRTPPTISEDGTVTNPGRQVGDMAGEETVSLTANQNGKHDHMIVVPAYVSEKINDGGYTYQFSSAGSENINVGTSGEGAPHNNMPPYIAVYIWERTA